MFLIYASLGQFALTNSDGTNGQIIGYLIIVFACLFIFVFAATWGPMAWTVISEIFPSQFRSVGISLSCTSVWIFNFYIAFSTSFVVNAIGFAYGYFFAARTLEEIDTMFLLAIKPWKSSKWVSPSAEESGDADRRRLSAAGKLPMREKSRQGSLSGDAIHAEDVA
ncbi:putative major facilitator, sugar transporter, major facilitator superfamily [Septoria linicola]|nr:putative major facilitator, sugar transporter, major facilitator superfamily [Septoria linicola]